MTQANEKLVWMTSRLYDARDSMRSLYGADYPQMIKMFQESIQNEMKASGSEDLPAMIELVKRVKGNVILSLLLMAAYVEMVEPSTFEARLADDRKLARNMGE